MTDLIFKLFIKDKDNTADHTVRERYGVVCGFVGIICNILLSAFKISIGLISKSISIMADGLNNLSDMGSSVISTIGFKLAGKPADNDHPFGHGRIEYLSAFIVEIIIMIVGFELFSSSISALINGDKMPAYSTLSIIILAVSIVIKLWLFLFNRKAGKIIESETLLATAQDSVNDVIATAVILVSVIISMLVKLPFNLDAVMGIGVSVFIMFSGIGAAKSTIGEILGGPASPQLTQELHDLIMSFEGFHGVHDLMVHNYGPGRQFASVHVEVPSDCDIVRCHEQIDLCEKVVGEKLGLSLVIHMDPVDVNDENIAKVKSLLTEKIKQIDGRLSIHDFRMTPKGENRTNLIFDVVVPNDIKISEDELKQKIGTAAYDIDSTYCCVITIDREYARLG